MRIDRETMLYVEFEYPELWLSLKKQAEQCILTGELPDAWLIDPWLDAMDFNDDRRQFVTGQRLLVISTVWPQRALLSYIWHLEKS
jgi:hypothetical protein